VSGSGRRLGLGPFYPVERDRKHHLEMEEAVLAPADADDGGDRRAGEPHLAFARRAQNRVLEAGGEQLLGVGRLGPAGPVTGP
jgi:hypothetical protein